MRSCYLFDFDYTLVDSSEGIVKCFSLALDAIGRPRVNAEAIKRTIGLPMPDAVSLLLGTDDKSEVRSFLDAYMPFADEYMTDLTRFFPETVPTLSALKEKGARVVIVSSKTGSRIMEKFEREKKTQLVDMVIGNHDVSRLKPDPEGILLALERFDTAKSDALYVGDSIVDAEAAKNAGVDFAGVTTGVTPAEDLVAFPHVAIMKNLSQVLAL